MLIRWITIADQVQLENALLNLAVNARDAMTGRGQLTITTRARTVAVGAVGELPGGDYLAITVGDTGCGMSTEVMERVFEELSFTAPDRGGEEITVDEAFVEANVGKLARSADISRYVL